jgi:hypothetical protein
MSKSKTDKQGRRQYREMTVAHIRELKGADHVEVVFLESARFYRLLKKNPTYDGVLTLLLDAMAKGRVLKVRCASPESDIIKEVQEHSSDASEWDG